MAANKKTQPESNTSDDERPETVAVVKSESTSSGLKRPQEPPTIAVDSPATNSKQRKKEGNAAAAASLAAIYEATPGKSQNRAIIKDLQAERKKIVKEKNQMTAKVRAEAQRQKRLIDKASKLSNEDLLEIFRQRHELKEAKEKAAAKAKAKAKSAAGGQEN